MSESASATPHAETTGRGDGVAVASLVIALVAVGILLVTFRELVFITLPLAVIAFGLGIWGAVSAARPSARALAVAGLALGLLALLISAAALATEVTVDGGYDFYERRP